MLVGAMGGGLLCRMLWVAGGEAVFPGLAFCLAKDWAREAKRALPLPVGGALV